MNIYHCLGIYKHLSEKLIWNNITEKIWSNGAYLWLVCPMDLSFKGDLCLSVCLPVSSVLKSLKQEHMCLVEGQGPLQNYSPPPHLLWISPSLFLSPSSHLSTYDAREEICCVPWEQSMSAESRGKKAREPGRRALEHGAVVRRPAHKEDGSRPKLVWMWRS